MDMQGSTRTDAPRWQPAGGRRRSCRPPSLLKPPRPAAMTKSPSAVRHAASDGAAPDGASSRRVPWPPDPFSYSDGRLCVGGLPLDEVVAGRGPPAYVYALDAAAAAYRRAAAAFEPLGGRVLYAVKA